MASDGQQQLPASGPVCAMFGVGGCRLGGCLQWDAVSGDCCFIADLAIRRAILERAAEHAQRLASEKAAWWQDLRWRLVKAAGMALGIDVAKMMWLGERFAEEHPEEFAALSAAGEEQP